MAWIIGGVLLAALGYVAAGPYLAIADIKNCRMRAIPMTRSVSFPSGCPTTKDRKRDSCYSVTGCPGGS